MTNLLLILALLGGAPAPAAPERLELSQLFGKVAVTGAEYSERARSLDGKRVLFRGFAVLEPRPEGALFLTRTPVERLHPDDEETLPGHRARGLAQGPGAPASPPPAYRGGDAESLGTGEWAPSRWC